MSDQAGPPDATGQSAPSDTSEPSRQAAWRGQAELIALLAALGLASGALGALLATRLTPPAAGLTTPSPPLRIGVISLARIGRAIGSAGDPTAAPGAAFDAAVKQLARSQPGLILLVKEAVIDTGDLEDYTDALLPLLSGARPSGPWSAQRRDQRPPLAARPAPEPPGTPEPDD